MDAATKKLPSLQATLAPKPLDLTPEPVTLRESIHVSVFVSHHKHMFTPIVADKLAKPGQVAFLVHFNSQTPLFTIYQYRHGNSAPEKKNVTSIAPTSFESAFLLFGAIQAHLSTLGLDISKILLSADGNLGSDGKGMISEHFRHLVSVFSPSPPNLIIFSNTPDCLLAAEIEFPEVTAIVSNTLGQVIVALLGKPLQTSKTSKLPEIQERPASTPPLLSRSMFPESSLLMAASGPTLPASVSSSAEASLEAASFGSLTPVIPPFITAVKSRELSC